MLLPDPIVVGAGLFSFLFCAVCRAAVNLFKRGCRVFFCVCVTAAAAGRKQLQLLFASFFQPMVLVPVASAGWTDLMRGFFGASASTLTPTPSLIDSPDPSAELTRG